VIVALALAGVVLVLAVILPLATPVHVRLRARSDPATLKITLRLVGGFAPAIRVFDSTRRRRKRAAKPESDRNRAGKSADRSGSAGWASPRAGVALARQLLRLIRVHRIEGVLIYGAGDPADTGQVYGLLMPVCVVSQGRFQVHPDFHNAVLGGRLDVELSVIPLALLPAGVRVLRARHLARHLARRGARHGTRRGVQQQGSRA